MQIEKKIYGSTQAGEIVHKFTLKNKTGAYIEIINYGGTVLSIFVFDKMDNLCNICGKLADLQEYEAHDFYLGCIVGRVANRIGGASFTLNGEEYRLAATTGTDTLHGGTIGFNRKVWDAQINGDKLVLSYTSPDGEEGFPGTLRTTVTYEWTENNELVIEYFATTDTDTVINLTNHTYFNLAGQGDILNHTLTLHADRFTPATKASITTGEIAPVAGTPLDFTTPHTVGTRIDAPFDQLVWAGGYDQNFVLSSEADTGGLRRAAELYDPSSGRVMTMYTTEPGVQLYTGNYLNGTYRSCSVLTRRSHLCLEAQHFPNAVNIQTFPSMLLKPGETYHQKTVYQFSVKA